MLLAQPAHVRIAADLHSHGRFGVTAGPIVNLVLHAGDARRVISAPARPCHDPMLDNCDTRSYAVASRALTRQPRSRAGSYEEGGGSRLRCASRTRRCRFAVQLTCN